MTRGAPARSTAHGAASRSAFLSPVVWMLALIVGLGGFGQFTVTYFVPSVAKALYGLDADGGGSHHQHRLPHRHRGESRRRRAGRPLQQARRARRRVHPAGRRLRVADHREPADLPRGDGGGDRLRLHRGESAVRPRRLGDAAHEAGHAMGVVSLGAGLFGYFGPQMLGILRDRTGSFAAGFYMVAIADVITLTLIAVLYRMTRGVDTNMNRPLVTCMLRAGCAEPHRLRPGAASACHRRPAPAVCLRADGSADAVSRLRPEDVGWEGVAADHPDAARRRREREHVPRSGRWPADETRRAARLHRRLAAGVHAARRLWQSASAAGGLRPDRGGRLAASRCHAGASARART